MGPRLFLAGPTSMAMGLLRPIRFGDSFPAAKCESDFVPACAAVVQTTSVVSTKGACNQAQQWGNDGICGGGVRRAYQLPYWVHRQQAQMSRPKLPMGLKNNIAVLLPRNLRMARE